MGSKKYSVVGTITVSVYIQVQADSQEEAIAKAKASTNRELCHQCAMADYDEDNPQWCIDELDGEAQGPFEVSEVEECWFG